MSKRIGGDVGSGGHKTIGGNVGLGGHKTIGGNVGLGRHNGGSQTPRTEGDCFVATVTFGSPLHSEIQILREWRDNTLRYKKGGRRFISWYYTHGPKKADFIRKHPSLKKPIRLAIKTIIKIIK